MNATERSILEQFPYWHGALETNLDAAALRRDCLTVVVGCGTSYYLAQTIVAQFNALGHEALAVPGGEWHLRRQYFVPLEKPVQVLALSRSGETTETLAAARASLERGEHVVGVTCEADSSLTRACTHCVYVPTHPDEDIVMTSSASLMLLIGLRLAGTVLTEDAILAAQGLLEASRTRFDAILREQTHFVYLGGGALYGMASEGALKLMEMSLSYAQAYHPLEYRHGPISLLDERSLAVLLYQPEALEEESKLSAELRGKGARVIGFGGPGDLGLEVSESSSALRGLIVLPSLQWLGERVAQAKGMNTREPRHLTKVVVLT
jgi:glutamine---fructose-6-phosphate transaminase (isomerizing)